MNLTILGFFSAAFENDFIGYALLAGLIVGILAPAIGSIVVIRRLTFIADTLSHFSLAGVCLGVILSKIWTTPLVSPVIMGIVFSILGTILIEKLRGFYKNYKEISMPIIMSLGMAVSGLLIDISSDINSRFTTSILYGSIFSVSTTDIIIILIISFVIVVFFTLYYKQILTICFDETYAKVSGINTSFIQFLLTIVLALVISLFIDIIGVLLISSLMILPVAAAILIGEGFLNTLFIAISFSEFSLISGFVISYHAETTTGPIVILINLFIYLIVLIIKRVRQHILKRRL